MAKQPEVGPVALSSGRSDEFSEVSERNPMRFVAFYRAEVMEGGVLTNVANVLRAKTKVKVPASRACPDADKQQPDGTPLCNYEGWSAEDSLVAKPPEVCPGKRYDGRACGKVLLLKNEQERYLRASEYQFEAKSPQQARFLASKFPKDTDLADDYVVMNHNGALNGMTYPGKGRTWRAFLDQDILPAAKRANYKAITGPRDMIMEVEPPRPQRA